MRQHPLPDQIDEPFASLPYNLLHTSMYTGSVADVVNTCSGQPYRKGLAISRYRSKGVVHQVQALNTLGFISVNEGQTTFNACAVRGAGQTHGDCLCQ